MLNFTNTFANDSDLENWIYSYWWLCFQAFAGVCWKASCSNPKHSFSVLSFSANTGWYMQAIAIEGGLKCITWSKLMKRWPTKGNKFFFGRLYHMDTVIITIRHVRIWPGYTNSHQKKGKVWKTRALTKEEIDCCVKISERRRATPRWAAYVAWKTKLFKTVTFNNILV